ncbi:MAG TPA: NAD(P)H-dependent glycerol-3-phosphate dehydrogenase [Chitinophagaceae bacterium]|nr:NAD(P)H-dependent glycerol-3-phosphate dehydrogenase [Chitinophagaceae bacterium]
MSFKIGILGNGSWATALAKIITDNDHAIKWWMRSEIAVNHLIQKKHNLDYLSSVSFNPKLIEPSKNIKLVIENCNAILIAIPSAYLVEVLDQLPADIFQNKYIISAVKGILPQSHSLLNDYLAQNFNFDLDKYICISGPCHAEEVAQERLSYLTFSGNKSDQVQNIAKMFETDYIRVTTNGDIYGTQYAGVLKNIYAVGAGIAHGLGYGDNFLSVYITNCYRESICLLDKLHDENKGIERPDVHTSAYLGDLLVTCYSPHSRNRSFGTLIGKGYSISSAIREMNMVAEGYYATKGMHHIIKDTIQLDMPICHMLHDILWQGRDPRSAFKEIESLLN